jgi:hypothetical protein
LSFLLVQQTPEEVERLHVRRSFPAGVVLGCLERAAGGWREI